MYLASLLASSDDSSGNGSAALIQLGIFLLIPVGFYFLMIRPQRRRMREQAALQSDISVGDEIITTSGMFGFVTGFDGNDRVWVEIDDDVQVRLARAAIQSKVDTAATSGEPPARPADEPQPSATDEPTE